jgi:hypothetical protein
MQAQKFEFPKTLLFFQSQTAFYPLISHKFLSKKQKLKILIF